MELPDKETPMENLPNEVSADTRLPCLLASSSTVAPPSCVATSASNNNEAQNSLSGAAVVIRMRGLPCDCTAAQIIEFFKAGGEGNAVDVFDGEGGIFIVQAADGRATTDAFVFLSSEEDAVKALSKQDSIGLRYIEHLRSTTAEIKQAVPHISRASNAVQLLLRNWPAKKASISTNEQLAGKPAAAKPANALSKAATTNVTQKKPVGSKGKELDSSSSSDSDSQKAKIVAKKNALAVKSTTTISPIKQAAQQKTKKDSSSDDSDSTDDKADAVPPQKRLKASSAAVTSKSSAASAPVNKLQPSAVIGRKAESSSSDDSSDDEAAAKPAAQKPIQVKKPVASVPMANGASASVVATKIIAARDDSSLDSDDSSKDEGETAKPTNAFKSAPVATAVKGCGAAASKSALAAASKKAETSSSDSDSSESGNKAGKTPMSVAAANGPAAKTANTLAKAAVTSKKPAPKKASSFDDSSSSGDEQQMAAVKQLSGRYVCYVCSIRVDDSGSYNEHLSSRDHITAVKQSSVITDKPIPQAPPKTAAYYANKARKQERNRANRYAKKAAARALL